ncbi:uncharacterized protein O9250_012249 isoform 2-T6 [Rhynochetos jubatus]
MRCPNDPGHGSLPSPSCPPAGVWLVPVKVTRQKRVVGKAAAGTGDTGGNNVAFGCAKGRRNSRKVLPPLCSVARRKQTVRKPDGPSTELDRPCAQFVWDKERFRTKMLPCLGAQRVRAFEGEQVFPGDGQQWISQEGSTEWRQTKFWHSSCHVSTDVVQ